MTGRPISRIARVLGISRATAYRDRGPRASRYHRLNNARVWNRRHSERDQVTSSGVLDDLREINSVPADDRVLVKVSHRFDLPR